MQKSIDDLELVICDLKMPKLVTDFLNHEMFLCFTSTK